jgi:3-hydroxybutyryl-CoA dehydrogenase
VLSAANDGIKKQMIALVQKGKIDEQKGTDTLNNLRFTSKLDDCHADFFIEAIVEKLSAKIELFHALMSINDAGSVFASNTSSLSISELASQIPRPTQVIGLHFFNPAPLMKLVEVVTTPETSEETLSKTMSLAQQMGKTFVVCKDSPGFIVNRVARPYYIESLRLAEEGIANFESIDAILESSGFKMGPFRLMDLIGNDVNFAVSNSVYDQLGKPERLRPSSIQKEKVHAGNLGKKTGKGYYNY